MLMQVQILDLKILYFFVLEKLSPASLPMNLPEDTEMSKKKYI